MAWHGAPSLLKLRAEVDKAWPKRSKSSDGMLGDAAHAARPSEHNPQDVDGVQDVVTAIDITATDPKIRQAILDATIGDSRVWYVINKGKIWSRTHGFKEQNYTGSNPHTSHVHISLVQKKTAINSKATWLEPAAAPEKPEPKPTQPVVGPGDNGLYVAFLNRYFGLPNTLGYGPQLGAAIRRFQDHAGLTVDGYVGAKTWAAIAKGGTVLPKY